MTPSCPLWQAFVLRELTVEAAELLQSIAEASSLTKDNVKGAVLAVPKIFFFNGDDPEAPDCSSETASRARSRGIAAVAGVEELRKPVGMVRVVSPRGGGALEKGGRCPLCMGRLRPWVRPSRDVRRTLASFAPWSALMT